MSRFNPAPWSHVPIMRMAGNHLSRVWIRLSGAFITPELLREADRVGADVWTYDYNLRVTNAEANRFYSGLYTWSLGLKGNLAFTYIWDEPNGSVFDSNWRFSSPFSLGYIGPSPRGPVPGVGWEGRREGVDDVRYLQLLEARLAAASQDDALTHQARRWIRELRERSLSPEFDTNRHAAWGTDYMDPNRRIAAGDYNVIRAEAAEFIMRLDPADGEQNSEPARWMRFEPKALEADALGQIVQHGSFRTLSTRPRTPPELPKPKLRAASQPQIR